MELKVFSDKICTQRHGQRDEKCSKRYVLCDLLSTNLHDYFNIHVGPSKGPVLPVTLPIPVVVLQNVTNICLVCVKREKYALMVTLIPLGSMRQGQAKLCILQY